MLLAGKASGMLNFWLDRNKHKDVVFVPEELPKVYRMVELLDRRGPDYLGLESIIDAWHDLGYKTPTGKEWLSTNTLRKWAQSPYLFGCHYLFGREWPLATPNGAEMRRLYPSPFISDEEYDPTRPLAHCSIERGFGDSVIAHHRNRLFDVLVSVVPLFDRVREVMECLAGHADQLGTKHERRHALVIQCNERE